MPSAISACMGTTEPAIFDGLVISRDGKPLASGQCLLCSKGHPAGDFTLTVAQGGTAGVY